MARARHPTKEIEAAVQHAETLGWRLVKSRGHAWGRLFCPRRTREGCMIVVWSTPKSAENHANAIRRKVARCQHSDEDPDNGGA